jgi:hypothetical protein
LTEPVVPARFYLDRVLAELPRALTLLDRDPSSPSHGCFDRNYWHYRTQDFPSGMYQELVLPLAQLHALSFAGNRWYGEPRLRELALAGIDFAARSAHADGSCDDYFPYERALGATAFAAAAAAEALWLLGDRDPARLAFLRRRCEWLLGHDESGRLTNHHALVALAAARTARLVDDASLREGARARLSRCLEWQHAEGWFPEYEGADPGYQTLNIAFLAALAEILPSPELDAALDRATGFAAHFLHPDGSFGGETGSRNTCQVLPSGFERLAARSSVAGWLADGWLAGAAAGRAGHPDDDRIFGHWIHDFVTAHLARWGRRGAPAPRWSPPPGRTSFPAAGLHVIRDDEWTLAVATGKGGVLRACRGEKLVLNDTGLVARAGAERWVMHQIDPEAEVRFEERALVVRGSFQRAPRHLPTPLRQVAFRAVNASVGRAAPDLLRRLLQRVLITGKRPAPLRFERRIAWGGGKLEVSDRLEAVSEEARRIDALWASSDATSIYVATSNLWQAASLQGWEPLHDAAEALRRDGHARVERSRR